jgi:EAL domain-containing protein (putative c-di-GMP-specific phosphodiesterase class I)
MEFVPVAEERGLIQLIGAHVLEQALAALAGWRTRYPEAAESLTMSVNLSPLQVRDQGHMDLFGKAIASSNVPPQRVKIEITESVFVDLTPEIVDSLDALRKVGVQLVLDDFGTGYSSLNHLQALPFDGLKVDRAFVARALNDVRNRNLVRSIASLAGGLSMHSVAEGVETEAQRDFLREAGYDYLQGFLFGRPQSHSDVEATLAAASLHRPRTSEM